MLALDSDMGKTYQLPRRNVSIKLLHALPPQTTGLILSFSTETHLQHVAFLDYPVTLSRQSRFAKAHR